MLESLPDGVPPLKETLELYRRLEIEQKGLRTQGPCFLCSVPTPYQPCGYHRNYGDRWLTERFAPEMREKLAEELKNLGPRRWSRGQPRIRVMVNYTCAKCVDELERICWPAVVERGRGVWADADPVFEPPATAGDTREEISREEDHGEQPTQVEEDDTHEELGEIVARKFYEAGWRSLNIFVEYVLGRGGDLTAFDLRFAFLGDKEATVVQKLSKNAARQMAIDVVTRFFENEDFEG